MSPLYDRKMALRVNIKDSKAPESFANRVDRLIGMRIGRLYTEEGLKCYAFSIPSNINGENLTRQIISFKERFALLHRALESTFSEDLRRSDEK